MQEPFYGRTGLLTDIGFVTYKTSLSQPSTTQQTQKNTIKSQVIQKQLQTEVKLAKQTLKWQPTLLMVPQALLDYFLHVDEANTIDEDEPGVDVSLANYLRLSCITQLLWTALNITSVQQRKAYCRSVFRWHSVHQSRLQYTGKVLNGKLSWYVPSYDLVTFHNGKEVYRRRSISHHALTLLGKDESVNHYVLRHNGCSSQHAAIHVNFVFSYEQKLLSYMRQYILHDKDNDNIKDSSNNEAKLQKINQSDDNNDNQTDNIVSVAWNALISLQQTGDVQHDAHSSKQVEQKQRARCISANKFAQLWSVELMITDLASTNGTIVQGEKLKPFTPFRLIEGDHISFIGSPFTYMIARSMT